MNFRLIAISHVMLFNHNRSERFVLFYSMQHVQFGPATTCIFVRRKRPDFQIWRKCCNKTLSFKKITAFSEANWWHFPIPRDDTFVIKSNFYIRIQCFSKWSWETKFESCLTPKNPPDCTLSAIFMFALPMLIFLNFFIKSGKKKNLWEWH